MIQNILGYLVLVGGILYLAWYGYREYYVPVKPLWAKRFGPKRLPALTVGSVIFVLTVLCYDWQTGFNEKAAATVAALLFVLFLWVFHIGPKEKSGDSGESRTSRECFIVCSKGHYNKISEEHPLYQRCIDAEAWMPDQALQVSKVHCSTCSRNFVIAATRRFMPH